MQMRMILNCFCCLSEEDLIYVILKEKSESLRDWNLSANLLFAAARRKGLKFLPGFLIPIIPPRPAAAR
jgi:hypothetical protein